MMRGGGELVVFGEGMCVGWVIEFGMGVSYPTLPRDALMPSTPSPFHSPTQGGRSRRLEEATADEGTNPSSLPTHPTQRTGHPTPKLPCSGAYGPSIQIADSNGFGLWSQGILNEVWKNKLIFVETPDANETSIALENYRRVRVACYHLNLIVGKLN